MVLASEVQFLSTPSARRATEFRVRSTRQGAISIHALREEGDSKSVQSIPIHERISIHALREEGDVTPVFMRLLFHRFLSTPSARRATSIRLYRQARQTHFYPRPPRGGRLQQAGNHHQRLQFLSTPSARRATVQGYDGFRRVHNFYPRPPRGGRRCLPCTRSSCRPISIHALREEGDSRVLRTGSAFDISIHALREEGDPSFNESIQKYNRFLSTPSARRATQPEGLLV